jgi:hypothetical protein
MSQLDPNESNPAVLWAEIARLQAAVAGPDGYASWQEAATAERVRRVAAERRLAEVEATIPRNAIMVAQDEALRHRADHSYLPQDRKDAVRWMPHNWVIAAIYAYAAQFKRPDDAGDTRRLEWLAEHWGGQRRDFSLHVLTRGGTGDLSDIRTFVDAEMRQA